MRKHSKCMQNVWQIDSDNVHFIAFHISDFTAHVKRSFIKFSVIGRRSVRLTLDFAMCIDKTVNTRNSMTSG